jgi:hypothetical protein
MSRYAFLNSQDSFPDLTTAIFHNRRLPIGVRSPQLFDQTSSKSKFGQRSLKSVFVFELFALLCREISFKKNLARIVLLSVNNAAEDNGKESNEQSSTNPPHHLMTRESEPLPGRLSFHRRRELVE